MIEVKGLCKSYRHNNRNIDVLLELEMFISPLERVCIMGKSGCGKSTLLSILGGLEPYDKGSVRLLGEDMGAKNERELSLFRRKNIGFVFQSHQLLKDFNVLENVMLPGKLVERDEKKLRVRAEKILEKLSLSHRLTHGINDLSGGEAQRVAIGRALINDPPILLADEPTGNIDDDLTHSIIRDVFLLAENKMTMIFVTHSKEVAKAFGRTLFLEGGQVTLKPQVV